MSKPLQAYFHTENDAENVRIKLETLRVKHIEVGALEVPFQPGSPPLSFPSAAGTSDVPVEGGTGSYDGPGGTGARSEAPLGAYVGIRPIRESPRSRTNDGVDDRELQYVLSAIVEESDVDDALEIIRGNQGHVESLG